MNDWCVTAPPCGHAPEIDDVLLFLVSLVGVQDQVTVPTKELPVGGAVYFHLVPLFHTPDLQTFNTINCDECDTLLF